MKKKVNKIMLNHFQRVEWVCANYNQVDDFAEFILSFYL